MKTDNNIKDDVYDMLLHSGLASEVSGEIRKVSRSPISENEDVIISVLANDSPKQVQEAIVNVNIYIKDIRLTATNDEEYFVEDTNRTAVVSEIIAGMFENAYVGESYRITLDRLRVLPVEATHEHCINVRLLYQQINS